MTHLKVFHVWEACRNPSEAVVVQVQLSQPWQVGQTAVLNVAEVIETKSQSGRTETGGKRKKIRPHQGICSHWPELFKERKQAQILLSKLWTSWTRSRRTVLLDESFDSWALFFHCLFATESKILIRKIIWLSVIVSLLL